MNYWKKARPPLFKDYINMCRLLRKDVPFEWTAECDAELEYLKK